MNREQFIAEVERRGYSIHRLNVLDESPSIRSVVNVSLCPNHRRVREICITAESFEAILEELPYTVSSLPPPGAEFPILSPVISFTNAQKSAEDEHQWNNFIAGSPCKAGDFDEDGLVRPANLAAVAIDESVLPECSCLAIELAAAGHLPGCPYPAAKAEAERDAEAGVDD